MDDSAIRILIAIVLGVMFIAAALTGRPGSIIGALVDADSMELSTGSSGAAGGGSSSAQ
jgi:hypothetical protein